MLAPSLTVMEMSFYASTWPLETNSNEYQPRYKPNWVSTSLKLTIHLYSKWPDKNRKNENRPKRGKQTKHRANKKTVVTKYTLQAAGIHQYSTKGHPLNISSMYFSVMPSGIFDQLFWSLRRVIRKTKTLLLRGHPLQVSGWVEVQFVSNLPLEMKKIRCHRKCVRGLELWLTDTK